MSSDLPPHNRHYNVAVVDVAAVPVLLRSLNFILPMVSAVVAVVDVRLVLCVSSFLNLLLEISMLLLSSTPAGPPFFSLPIHCKGRRLLLSSTVGPMVPFFFVSFNLLYRGRVVAVVDGRWHLSFSFSS